MSRIFDHKKQYACTEVFRLEELQSLADELENDETYDDSVPRIINEFITNLKEQERKK